MRKLLLLLTFLFTCGVYAQQPQAYTLFDHNGKPTTYDAMMDSLSRADVVFFGENAQLPHYTLDGAKCASDFLWIVLGRM